MKRRQFYLLFAAVLLTLPGCIVIPVGDLLKPPALQEVYVRVGAGFWRKEKIAIIDIRGTIVGRETRSLLRRGENVVAQVSDRLKRARQDPDVRAVVLSISSPGGEVTACDVIHHEIKEFKKEKGVPVIVSIGDEGTSGALYVAMAGDHVMAHPTSVVGSIGVILQSFDVSGLMEKVGISVTPIKSAEKKDLASPFRAMSTEEKDVLQSLVNDAYQRFLEIVDEGRPNLSREQVRKLADGSVLSGAAARASGLVDDEGYLEDAIELAKDRAGISSPTVVRYARYSLGASNLYSMAPVVAGRDGATVAEGELRLSVATRGFRSPRLYYIWHPEL